MGFRRDEISLFTRKQIACQMMEPDRRWGLATKLSSAFGVSRQFLYDLRDRALSAVEEALLPLPPGPKKGRRKVVVTPALLERCVVALKREAHASQRAVQTCLSEILDTHVSLGKVNAIIAKAESGATTFNAKMPCPEKVRGMVADELFSQGKPNLLLADPDSLFIFRLVRSEQCDGTTWGYYLLEAAERLVSTGIPRLASDAGRGLCKGVSESLVVEEHQPLQRHHVLRLLWRTDSQLERKAYAAIAREYEREEMFLKASTTKRIKKNWRKYQTAREAAEQMIDDYDTYHRAAEEVAEALEFIDPQTGSVRTESQVRPRLEAVLGKMERINHWAAKQAVSCLRNQMCGLLSYLWKLQQEFIAWSETLGESALKMVCRWWRLARDLSCKRLAYACQKVLQDACAKAWEQVVSCLQDRTEEVAQAISHWLDNVLRGSSLAEAINSLLRPILNARKHLKIGCLDLFVARHNTRPFRQGKRAGKSPAQLADITLPSDDWLTLIGLPAKS